MEKRIQFVKVNEFGSELSKSNGKTEVVDSASELTTRTEQLAPPNSQENPCDSPTDSQPREPVPHQLSGASQVEFATQSAGQPKTFDVHRVDMFKTMTDDEDIRLVKSFELEAHAIAFAISSLRASIRNCYEHDMDESALRSYWFSFGDDYWVFNSKWAASSVRDQLFAEVFEEMSG